MSHQPFPAPGLHHDVSEASYHAVGWQQGIVSKSLLWDFYPNPHKWRFGPPKETTSAMSWGSLVDCLLLTPDQYESNFITLPEDAPKKPTAAQREAKKPSPETVEAVAWWDRFNGLAWNKTVISMEDFRRAMQAVQAVEAQPFAGEIVASSLRQISIVSEAKEPQTGLPFKAKCRLDIVPKAGTEYADWLWDFKTTRSLAGFDRTIANFGYHAQSSFYLDVFNAATGENRTRWGFIVQESAEPFEVAVFELDQADIIAGRKWYKSALALWCRCQRDQSFPSPWDEAIQPISRPRWAQYVDEQP